MGRYWARWIPGIRGLLATALMAAVTLGMSIDASPTFAGGDDAPPSPPAAAAGIGLAWGSGTFGQLGGGTNEGSNVPVAVNLPPDTTITSVAGGGSFSLAVTSAGTVLAWGFNFSGQLGNGTTTNSNVPVQVRLPAGTTITSVAAGRTHSLALTSTGAVWAWGQNISGELGNGTNSVGSSVPVQVRLPAGTTVIALAAGKSFSLALTSTGNVLAWGRNAEGELGDGSIRAKNVPVRVNLPAGTTVTAIAAGANHSLAVTSTGTGLAWGDNTWYQLGNRGPRSGSTVPVPVNLPGGTTITSVAGGDEHSLAVTSTGTGLAWGRNLLGQLGTGAGPSYLAREPIPVTLPADTTITAIAAGANDSLALTSTGAALAWGSNLGGQLGNGTNVSSSNLPVAVSLPLGAAAKAIAAGGNHDLAITGPIPTANLPVTAVRLPAVLPGMLLLVVGAVLVWLTRPRRRA